MQKKLLLIEGRTVKAYNLGKASRAMTIVRQRLFRTDDRLFWCDFEGPDSIIIYDLDSTQPYGTGTKYLDPDTTMAFIDIARTNHKKNVGLISTINSLNGMTFVYIAVAIVILLSVLKVI